MNNAELENRILQETRRGKKGACVFPGVLFPFQRQVYEYNSRHKMMPVGRRGSKTWLGTWITSHLAATDPPGSEVWVVAPTSKLIENCWKKYIALIPSNLIYKYNTSKGSQEIILRNGNNPRQPKIYNGVRITFRSAESKGGNIGEGPTRVHLDEAGLIPEEVWRMELRPALWDNKAPTIWTGTPRSMASVYYKMFSKGAERNDEYASFRAPSFVNPYLITNFDTGKEDLREFFSVCVDIDPTVDTKALYEVYEQYYAGVDIYNNGILDSFDSMIQQEIFAVFLSPGGAVFHGLDACMFIPGAPTDTIEFGRKYYIGLDLGKQKSYTVALVIDENGRIMQDHYRDRKMMYSQMLDEVVKLAVKYNHATILFDSSGVGAGVGELLLDRAQVANIDLRGINFGEKSIQPASVTTVRNAKRNKEWLVDELRLAIEQQKIKLPQCDKLAWLYEEMSNFDYKILASGARQYSAQGNFSDDGVMALAMASIVHSNGEQQFEGNPFAYFSLNTSGSRW